MLTASLVAFGCSGGVPAPATTPPLAADRSAAPTLPLIGSITLEIGEGPDAGSHSIDLPLASCISQGDAWRIEARDETAAGLSQVLLLGYPPFAGAQRFTLLAVVGPVLETSSHVYLLRIGDSTASSGSGSLDIEDQLGGGATLRVVGTTSAAVTLTLTVECGSVRRLPAEVEP